MTLRTFPALPGIIYPVVKTPNWLTDFTRSFGGKVTALARYSYPIYRWELGYSVLRAASAYKEWQELVAFYNLCNGRATPFLFDDTSDDAVTAQTFGTGDGATVAFQLLRSLTGSSNVWSDPVFAPNANPLIYNNGVLVSSATYSIGSTGVVTFNAAPAAGHTLTWTGGFKWICRFSEDSASFENFAYNFWELKVIKLDSEKV